ncbi:helix-turn-helix domain-containing protein [Streptosporangium canum]|uniref:helix-turn-helix domain-containing protein n=1 Tax=Streptosporangium canum TaxID=324952 RepID=UPI00343F97AF
MVKTPSWPVDLLRALLDRILDETGMSQSQLAALVPMDQSQLSRWKSGGSRPRFESLVALGEALREKHSHLNIGPDEFVIAGGYKTDRDQNPEKLETENVSSPQSMIETALNEQLEARLTAMQSRQDELLHEIRKLSRQIDDLQQRHEQGRSESDNRESA